MELRDAGNKLVEEMLSGTGYDENGNVTGWAPTISEPFDFHYRTINKGSFYEALYDTAL